MSLSDYAIGLNSEAKTRYYDRNGGYLKVFIGFICILVGYNVFLSYVTVWLCQWTQ